LFLSDPSLFLSEPSLFLSEPSLFYPSVAPIKDVHAKDEDLKFYNWNAAMNTKTKAGSQGICASGWRIPTDGF
jgi:hypothetical protein